MIYSRALVSTLFFYILLIKMKNYSKTQVYKLKNIFDKDEKHIYVGTTTNWAVRKYQHKRRCNDPTDRGYNWKIYQHIRNTGGMDNWRMELIEDYPCENYQQSSTKERYYIELYNAKLNTSVPLEY